MSDDPRSPSMVDSGDARTRLLELARERRSSLAGLSALIGRNSSYLQQFIRKGSPRKLEEQDRKVLAEFFQSVENPATAFGIEQLKSFMPKRKIQLFNDT